MKISKMKWLSENHAIYLTPMLGFSWGETYKRKLFVGWLYWLFEVTF